ncbi:NAD-dependent deacetylase [Amycolatopsis sp. NPDC059657]|uniref:SIR2 family NAD-dependent protein deacylase n=1 Tax=Amycolatopsis sp. NPDC059657 TaxID=3346899 RepID=UPI00366F754D
MHENHWSDGVTRIAVLTGAGISTDSGIPDYRGPEGVWTKNPDAASLFTYANYMADAEVRRRFWRTYVDHAAWRAEPNDAHHALAGLDAAGLAVRVLTQNIDGLHRRTTLAGRKVLELHGSMRSTVCTRCGAKTATESVLARIPAEPDPPCLNCGGVLKLAIVLFGQPLDADVLSQARTIAAASQLFLAIGSSLQVEPAASLCSIAVRAGAKLVIINRDPTPYDDEAVEVIREPIATAVRHIRKFVTDR